MKFKSRVWQGILFALILISVVSFGILRVNSADEGFPKGLASRDQILRGRYLVTAIGGCADCHLGSSPNDPAWLAGYKAGTPGQPFEIGQLRIYTPNITPDKETGIGNWTPRQVFNAFRQGKEPDGDTTCPPMPWSVYRNMTDRDTWAIVAYLKSVKPVKNRVPANTVAGAPPGTEVSCANFYQNLKPLPRYPGTNET